MHFLTVLVLIVVLMASPVVRAETNVNIGINLGAAPPPPPQRHQPPPPPRVVVAGPTVTFDVPPLFLSPSRLGFYVGVDMPYDLVMVSGAYYLFQNDHWYRSSHYNGPWTPTRYEKLPEPVRRHKMDKIRYYRDHEYDDYRSNRNHYHGKHYRPGNEHKNNWKEKKRREKEEWKRDRHERNQDRFDDRHGDNRGNR